MTVHREVYMEHRKDAEKFRESERGKYAIAQALFFLIEHHDQAGIQEHISKATIEDIQYLLSRIYMPYLWGGKRWYGDGDRVSSRRGE